MGLERTFMVLIFCSNQKKRLPAVRLHLTWYRFCTILILFFNAFARLLITLAPEVESSRTHFEVLGLGLEGQVLGRGLEASSPQKLACPRLEDSTIF